jgi:hypothetical protein
MMTIRLSSGQNELDFCVSTLHYAFEAGVISMRTKWFTIDAIDGLRWKSVAFCEEVLARVINSIQNRSDVSQDEFDFALFCGIHFSD